MRHPTGALAVLLMLAGCAAGSGSSYATVSDAAGAASPAPQLAGTWRGTAFAVSGSNYFTATPVELTINPDGLLRQPAGPPS